MSARHCVSVTPSVPQVTGNTIFNVLRMGDQITGANDRPLEPPRIVSIDILNNPFDDIFPRCVPSCAVRHNYSVRHMCNAPRVVAAAPQKKRKKKPSAKLKRTKLPLLLRKNPRSSRRSVSTCCRLAKKHNTRKLRTLPPSRVRRVAACA